MELSLYHGTNVKNEELRNDNVFFSTCRNFAADYGEVSKYTINVGEVFDSTSQAHIEQLLCAINQLYDSYNEEYVATFEEFEEASNYLSDTWEVIENHLSSIYRLGYDSALITEGGIVNYVVRNGQKSFQLAG